MFAVKRRVPGINLDTVKKIICEHHSRKYPFKKIRRLNCKGIKIMNGKVLKQTHIFYNILLLLISC